MEYHPTIYRIKKTIPVLIILIVLALVFINRQKLFSRFHKKDASMQTQSESVKTVPEAENKLSVADEKALQEQEAEIEEGGNLEECDQIKNDMYRSVCRNSLIMKKAKETKDATLCRQLDSKLVSISDCEKEILLKESLQGGDVSICSQAIDQDVKNTCEKNILMVQAVKEKNKDLCQKLKLDSDKLACHEFYTYSVDFIADMTNYDCSGFSTESFQSDCRLYQDNLRNNKQSSCEALKTIVFNSLCKYGLPPK
jgi:hypothetical protein